MTQRTLVAARRELLAVGGRLAAVGLLARGLTACSRSEAPRRFADLERLSPLQAEVLAVLVAALLPGGRHAPPGDAEGIVRALDHFLAHEDPALVSKLGDALLLLEWAPLFGRHLRRFTHLGPAERVEVFGEFARSRLRVKRSTYVALKSMVYFFYADDPRTWPAFGYDGPWVGRVAPTAIATVMPGRPATAPVVVTSGSESRR